MTTLEQTIYLLIAGIISAGTVTGINETINYFNNDFKPKYEIYQANKNQEIYDLRKYLKNEK